MVYGYLKASRQKVSNIYFPSPQRPPRRPSKRGTEGPTVHKETVAPTRPPAVPSKKEILVSTSNDDAPRTPDLTDCEDLLRPVQKYKAYHRVEHRRYLKVQRPKPPTFRATILTARIESYLMSGF